MANDGHAWLTRTNRLPKPLCFFLTFGACVSDIWHQLFSHKCIGFCLVFTPFRHSTQGSTLDSFLGMLISNLFTFLQLSLHNIFGFCFYIHKYIGVVKVVSPAVELLLNVYKEHHPPLLNHAMLWVQLMPEFGLFFSKGAEAGADLHYALKQLDTQSFKIF